MICAPSRCEILRRLVVCNRRSVRRQAQKPSTSR